MKKISNRPLTTPLIPPPLAYNFRDQKMYLRTDCVLESDRRGEQMVPKSYGRNDNGILKESRKENKKNMENRRN